MLGSIGRLIEALRGPARHFAGNTRGAVAIYVAVTGALFVGGGVLAIDVGRMVVAMAELQKAADSAALSGAVQLSGTPGACARATQLVQDKIKQASKLLNAATDLLPATTINFYELYVVGDPANQDLATEAGDDCDSEAAWIKVDLDPHQLDFLLTPVLSLVTGGGGSDFTNMAAYAVAEYLPLSCETAPLMQCIDNADDASPTLLLGTPPNFYTTNAGRQYRLNMGPGGPYSTAAGNFGQLDMGTGAAAFREAFNDPGANNLCGQDEVKPAPGAAAGPVVDGLNGRFNDNPPGGTANPAPNIMSYNEDATLTPINGDANNGTIGDGDWSPETYFLATHGATTPIQFLTAFLGVANGVAADGSLTYDPDGFGVPNPAPPVHLPTRYQVYLWELGVDFYVNGAMTMYPGPPEADAAAWRQIINPNVDVVNGSGFDTYTGTIVPNPAGRVSPTSRFNGFTNYCRSADDGECLVRHRTVLVMAVNCEALGLRGASTPITGLQQFIRYFLIRPAVKGRNAYIRGELNAHEGLNGVGAANDAIQGNVRLIE